MTITQTDRFGIRKIYLTSAYGFNGTGGRSVGGRGWEYHSIPWNQNKIYEHTPENAANGLLPEQLADVTMHYSKTHKSYVKINGNGSARFHLPEPDKEFKLSLFDENNLYYGLENSLEYGRRWTSNVEFTFYFSISSYSISNTSPYKKGNITIGLGSDHHFLDSTLANNLDSKFCPFNSHEYNLVITYDGHIYFTSEIYHGKGYSPPKPDDIYEEDFFGTRFTSIPLNTLYGIKFIKRVINTKNVMLEVYMDRSEGADGGGDWRKLFEFKHERNNWAYPNAEIEALWNISKSNQQYSVTRQVPKAYDDPVADGGGGLCYLKIDPIHEIELKWISCRDIEPEGFSPNTTSGELATESGLFGENPADNL